MRVGWARPGCHPDQDLGSDDQAFVFDGFKVWFMLYAVSYISEEESCLSFCCCAFCNALCRFNAGIRAMNILGEPGRLVMWLGA